MKSILSIFILVSLVCLNANSQNRTISGKVIISTETVDSGKTHTCIKNGKYAILTSKTIGETFGRNLTVCDSLGNFYFETTDTIPKIDSIHFYCYNSKTLTLAIDELRDSANIITLTGIVDTVSTENEVPNDSDSRIRIRGKPAIYLYPTIEQEVSIKLEILGTLGTSYPKYRDEWKVIATPKGELTNLSDNRKYNYLFWDGAYQFPASHYDFKSGFVVAKNDLDKFLIEKLSLIGLNNTEVNDFVVYWLPMLEKNEYNLIHFFINDNIDGSAFLNVKPKPDSEIRLFMEFKAVDKNYKITPQQLPSIPRKGFTLVEWGGGIIGDGKIQ